MKNTSTGSSELHLIQDLDLLTRLERWEAEIRASSTSEGVAQGTAVAGSCLALDCEIELSEVIGLQLECLQALGRLLLACLIFCLESLCQTTCTILAGPSALLLARLGGALRGYRYVSVMNCDADGLACTYELEVVS